MWCPDRLGAGAGDLAPFDSFVLEPVLRYPTDLIPEWAVGVDFSTNDLGALCLALMER